ncbi:MAG TPA: glycerate kinase [Bauldia sp.]|nr:glycerate kinase [Bauldia sp.]
MISGNERAFLRDLFDRAVAAALPARVVPPHLPPPPKGRTIVLGAGKASAAMAKAVEDNWPASASLSGLVVTRYGHGVPCRRIEIVEAAHPVPDAAGADAARRILELAKTAGPDDLVLCLISGGGSALLALPADGLTLADKQAVNRALLKSGATIGEMNTVRKHLSAIKGGRLGAAASRAKVVTLLISDVPGDDASVVASGPTVADPTTFADARAVIAKYGIDPPPAVAAHLAAAKDETPKHLPDASIVMVASPQGSLEAAAAHAERERVIPVILGDAIEGEARDVGRAMAAAAMQRRDRPVVLLSGGETTVTVVGKDGRGGRNGEFLAGLALALNGAPGIFAFAGDTDGIDGSEDNAGAIVMPDTLARAKSAGVDFAGALARNDMYPVFATLGDLVVTGPTLTNVNDFRAILLV